MFALSGDGYRGNKSPFTIFEKFRGMSINRAVALVYFGLLEPIYLELFLKVSEMGKIKIQEFFHLKKLYFTYTHLVCRSANVGKFMQHTIYFCTQNYIAYFNFRSPF